MTKEDFNELYHPGIFRYDIINMLIQRYGFTKYLEIGVEHGANFDKINIDHKESVDVVDLGKTTHCMSSNEFFANTHPDQKWDIIFIDGMHQYEQCYLDIVNASRHLEDNGFIVCHDMNPASKETASHNVVTENWWNGDVYKSFIKFRQDYLDFSSCLLYDCDMGLGIIHRGIGQNVMCDVDKLTFDEWANNKHQLMNCVSVLDFIKIFC